jgi:hypothetical protein
MNDTPYRPRTRLVHEGQRRSRYGETSEAIYLTQGFVYPDAEAAEARFKGELAEGEEGFIYARYGNPTVAIFEDRIAALEGAEAAFATASGMAAVHAALMCQLKAGDHVVAARALFGSCLYIIETLCPRFGVAVTLVDGTDTDQWRTAMRPETRACFLETPSNPTLEIIDIKAVAEIAHSVGARLVIDNVFATPMFQHPLQLGADVVVYSATKHIDGQGRCLGGVVLGTERFIRDEVEPYVKHTGPALSPFPDVLSAADHVPRRAAEDHEHPLADPRAQRIDRDDRFRRRFAQGERLHDQEPQARERRVFLRGPHVADDGADDHESIVPGPSGFADAPPRTPRHARTSSSFQSAGAPGTSKSSTIPTIAASNAKSPSAPSAATRAAFPRATITCSPTLAPSGSAATTGVTFFAPGSRRSSRAWTTSSR